MCGHMATSAVRALPRPSSCAIIKVSSHNLHLIEQTTNIFAILFLTSLSSPPMPSRKKRCQPADQRLATQRDEEITRRLDADRNSARRVAKIALFGPPGCGKSTFLKMARLARSQDAFSDEYRKSLRGEVFASIIKLMKEIIAKLDACDAFEDDALLKPHILIVLEAATPYEHQSLRPDLVYALKSLWGENLINERGYGMVEDEGHVVEYAGRHYLGNLDRIGSEGYVPSPEDIVKLHQPTQGITTTQYPVKDGETKLMFFEIGHMVSERRKWLPYIDDVQAIGFMVPLSMYGSGTGQGEDAGLSSVQRALDEYDALVNSPHKGLNHKPILLFLNGVDQFKRKLPSKLIKEAFQEFEGPESLSEAANFIHNLFVEKTEQQVRTVYSNFTASLDIMSVRFILENVHECLFQRPLQVSICF
ncbi:guanine nucleotide binding protein, alpha subunit [Emericellopsis atlantica]|uniref:Guanine nucleotide binding protein, alpha subunit n=1 Tax=Emericellopsis atlantica TaxID=2614577 RepID=A0A9P8CS83_9HYPO|nr:guanine nucleotide binding protein, alpha subunit [Emericellopsis atlantica]KAG9255481.1 guanine nucleotide binding protein, alpha subunit [Emericellopsis atlantica]